MLSTAGFRPQRRVAALAALSWILVLMTAALLGSRYVGKSQAKALDDYGEAPPFGLTDQLGRPVDSEQFRGKVVIADFVYTSCQDSCPLLSTQMHGLQERLRQERLLGSQVQILSFSTDPTRDTVPVLRGYAEQHNADPDAWRFLTGPEKYLVPLISQGFHLADQAVPKGNAGTGAAEYDVMHSNRFVLMDRQRRVRAYYDGLALDLDQTVRDIRRLLR